MDKVRVVVDNLKVCGNVDKMWKTFHRVIHIGFAIQGLGLGEFSTFPHTPTTTTTSFLNNIISSN